MTDKEKAELLDHLRAAGSISLEINDVRDIHANTIFSKTESLRRLTIVVDFRVDETLTEVGGIDAKSQKLVRYVRAFLDSKGEIITHA